MKITQHQHVLAELTSAFSVNITLPHTHTHTHARSYIYVTVGQPCMYTVADHNILTKAVKCIILEDRNVRQMNS